MTAWLGYWLGGGGAAAPAAPVATRRATSILDKAWKVLATAFHGSTTSIYDSVAKAAAEEAAQSLVVTKIASRNAPSTKQELTTSIRLMAQARKSSHTQTILDDAVKALERSDALAVVSKETSDEDFDELAATEGLYRQFQTVEIRG